MQIFKCLTFVILTENLLIFAFQNSLPFAKLKISITRSHLPNYFLSHSRQLRPVRPGWRCEEMRGKGNFEKEMCRNLEMSFRYVWLRLFTTGADENYIIALKDFVKNTVAAYDAGYSLPALILELGRNEIETGDPNVDKTVRLTDQERQTREVWLVLIYLTRQSWSRHPCR